MRALLNRLHLCTGFSDAIANFGAEPCSYTITLSVDDNDGGVTEDMVEGVVCLPHGWGHDKSGARLSVASQHVGVCNNVLAPGEFVDVISGNAVVNGIPVEVVPA